MRFLNAIAACLILFGLLELASHLAAQIRVGAAEEQTLLVGGGSLVVGVLLSAIANVGMKLDRIRERLEGTGEEGSEPSLN